MARESYFIERKGQLEHVWPFRIDVNGFESNIYIRGTENEATNYIHEELQGFGDALNFDIKFHVALDPEQEKHVAKMGCKVYIAPQD